MSLRARVLSGAVLWTIGLFVGGVLLSTGLMLRYRRYPALLHGTVDHYWGLTIVVVALCMYFGFRYVRSGLSPLMQLRTRLAAVHDGRDRRVDGRYPSEVQPLVDDLNALLEHRDATVRRALAKAGDLAHGLKTPLAVLAHEADRARAAGHADLAETLSGQVERMRRQIEYHLAHARAAASGAAPGAQSRVRESADGLARTLERLHAGRGISLAVNVDPAHAVRVQREDLDEMLGNLLDNACKWTRTRVTLTSTSADGTLRIDVDDDGPGVQGSMRDVVLQRGVRADEAAPGSGFGLAIVRDLAELYGGSITLDSAPSGGLRATLRLPAATA
ncbi:MAG TPA: sensor histidine kinase [Vicinamibacterales bacterium]|nr:sensor histidine kinase [Vicinamibacterales bacterium]